MNQPLTTITVFVFCIMAFVLTGTDDYVEEVAQAEQYRADVCAGVMPDYDNRGVECEIVTGKQRP